MCTRLARTGEAKFQVSHDFPLPLGGGDRASPKAERIRPGKGISREELRLCMLDTLRLRINQGEQSKDGPQWGMSGRTEKESYDFSGAVERKSVSITSSSRRVDHRRRILRSLSCSPLSTLVRSTPLPAVSTDGLVFPRGIVDDRKAPSGQTNCSR